MPTTPEKPKNRAAVALGRRGGKVGGLSRSPAKTAAARATARARAKLCTTCEPSCPRTTRAHYRVGARRCRHCRCVSLTVAG
jgi:hypothetical protein